MFDNLFGIHEQALLLHGQRIGVLAANLANALKSTGPRTDEGKKRSALNAVRHGLTGHVVVMPGEDLAVYRKYCESLMAKLDLDGAHEIAIGQSIAAIPGQIQQQKEQALRQQVGQPDGAVPSVAVRVSLGLLHFATSV